MADVILKLIIDGKEFDAKIKDADKQIAGLKKGVEKHAVDMTASLKSVAGAMGVAFGSAAVIGFMKDSLNEYMQQEAALKKLEVALGRVSTELEDYSNQLMRKSAFADDEIVEGMARIAMFTKEENQIKKLIEVSMDLAAAKGMDLVGAADLVAKSIGSEVNALGRYGVEVKGAIGTTERFNTLIEGTAKFSGQAAAQLETTAGKVKNLNNQWKELQERVGQAESGPLTYIITETNLSLDRWAKTFEGLHKIFKFLGLESGNEPLKNTVDDLKASRKFIEDMFNKKKEIPKIEKQITDEKKEQVKTERELWDIREKNMKEEAEYWEDFVNEFYKPSEQSKAGARGKEETNASAPIREMSETMKQSMGVVQDTTDAMWQNLIIGGRQAVSAWDAVWLAMRNSALQRIGEIVQNEIWNWLLGTLFSFIPGVGGVAGAAVQAVTSTPAGGGSSLPKLKVQVEGKLQGEDIYISNKRTAQRKTDNSL